MDLLTTWLSAAFHFADSHTASIALALMTGLAWYLGADGLAALKTWFREYQVYSRAKLAHDQVAAMARKTETKLDDKVAEFLRLFVNLMEASGLSATEADKTTAMAIANSLHEADTKAGVDDKSLLAEFMRKSSGQ